MISIDVRVDIRKAQVFLRATQQGTARATYRALNRAALAVRAEAVKLLRERRNLPASVIRAAMRIKNASIDNLQAAVIVSGQPISIRHFSNVNKRSITAKVTRGGARVLLRQNGNRAFTNPKLGGGVTPFVRLSKARLPIRAWPKVSGLPRVIVQARIAEALKAVGSSTFVKRFDHEMRRELERAKR
jgi:hypothetical protein